MQIPLKIQPSSRGVPPLRLVIPAIIAAAGIVLLASNDRPLAVVLGAIVTAAGVAAIAVELTIARRSGPSQQSISDAMASAERLAGLGSIAAAVAHEIRNPLSALDIHAQLLEEDVPDGSEARKRVGIIRAETHRLNLIVENFIRFARHTALDTRPTQMGEHLDNVMRLIDSEAADRNITIDHSGLRRDLPPVMADPNHLEQAFLNIVLNAVQTMPGGGRLTLASRLNAGYVECVVSNTGPEIPLEIRNRIFELFFTTKENGSGLGLPIAQKIMTQHKGYITVKSDPHETAFFLGIPAMPAK